MVKVLKALFSTPLSMSIDTPGNQEVDALAQVPALVINPFIDFCCSCDVQSQDGHLRETPFYSGPTGMPGKGINPAVRIDSE
ncbi:Cytochrome P450 4F12 [Manis pentadactyla]|nr:Cytochrome P450 4F12 [Manis pentadactyla]